MEAMGCRSETLEVRLISPIESTNQQNAGTRPNLVPAVFTNSGPDLRNEGREHSLLAQTSERKAMAAANACFFEDVLQVNLHSARSNA
jgi:hypothetical protein